MRQPRISDLDTRCSERFERESRLREKMRLGETTWGSAARARLSKGIGDYEMDHLKDTYYHMFHHYYTSKISYYYGQTV